MYDLDRLTLVAAICLGTACATAGEGDSGDDSFCVAHGGLVLVPSGHRAIETLRVGDIVYAWDTATNMLVETPVTAIRSARRECVAVEADGQAALICTPDHPLYDPQSGDYAPASEWVEGRRTQLLRVDSEGARLTEVGAMRIHAGVFEVYDITVQSVHHNFVAGGILVHNKSVDECYLNPDAGYCSPDWTTGADSGTSSGGSTSGAASTADGEGTLSGDVSTGGDSATESGGSEGTSGTGDSGSGTASGSDGDDSGSDGSGSEGTTSGGAL